jgi:XTP/dITP diphosphohydrolase
MPQDIASKNPLIANDELALESLLKFIRIVRRLRAECPWDREQTHASLRPMLIEEAYETVEAIDLAVDTGDYTELKKELGDMLLHILFHTDLACEEGHFSLKEVIDAECDKLIYRHPHVFGNTKVDDAEHVSRNWEQLKRREKGRNSVLDGVPVSLPALQRAARIQERASKVGFDWTNSKSVWKKVREEVFEFEDELTSPSSERGGGLGMESRKAEEFGDLLFSLVNLARHERIDPEAALREATKKFDRRFRKVEAKVEASGKPFADFTLADLDAIWDEVKTEEK